jgi:hypothetical protein
MYVILCILMKHVQHRLTQHNTFSTSIKSTIIVFNQHKVILCKFVFIALNQSPSLFKRLIDLPYHGLDFRQNSGLDYQLDPIIRDEEEVLIIFVF